MDLSDPSERCIFPHHVLCRRSGARDSDRQDAGQLLSDASEEGIETLTFLLSYILNDVTNADWKSIYQTQVYYIDRLVSFLQSTPQGHNLLENFCMKLKISSIKEYEQTILALTTLYISKKKENSRSCPILDLNEIVNETGFFHEEVCEYLSLDINKYIPYAGYFPVPTFGFKLLDVIIP